MQKRPTINRKFPKRVTISAPLTPDEIQMYQTLSFAELGSLQIKIVDMMARLRVMYQHLQAIREIQNDGYASKDVASLVAMTQLNVGILNEVLALVQSAGQTHDALQQDMTQLISESPTRSFEVERMDETTIDINVNGLRLQNYELSNFDAETIKEIRRQCSN